MPPMRKFPKDSLETALTLVKKIADENAGQPMDRLLLAHALGVSAGSSNYRYLMSSARTYGLTEGTEKAKTINLTPLGARAAKGSGSDYKMSLRKAAATPEVFKGFFERYDHAKLPSDTMLPKVLATEFGVPEDSAKECADLLVENGRFTGLIRDISGRPHVMLDGVDEAESNGDVSADDDELIDPSPDDTDEVIESDGKDRVEDPTPEDEQRGDESSAGSSAAPRPIFIGHGRNVGPMEQLERILTGFNVPFKRAVSEPNLGRPIPTKVKETMEACGSAIIIFTRDEVLYDVNGAEVWRPSENVVHELGAAAFAYGDRLVIFKEEGVRLASNYSSIGYIEFSEDSIEAKTAELLKELIGFGLLRLTPA